MDKSIEHYEFCACCLKLYPLKNRKQHLNSKRHTALITKMNITNEDIEFEHYTLQEDGEIEVNN